MQDWNRFDVGSKPAHCLENWQTSPREAPARAIPSHVACHMSHSHSSKTRRPARRKGPLSVWSDPGAGQASFFCQRGPHWSERPFGIGTDQGQWRHQISFILPAPREGPAGTGTRCGVRVQGAGVRGVRSLRARVAGGGRHGGAERRPGAPHTKKGSSHTTRHSATQSLPFYLSIYRQLQQHAAAHGQQQQMQMQPQWRTGTFSQEDCQVLKQPEADALALHFREVLGIPVEREANPSKDRPVRRTLPMVRADLESKWPVGLTSVAVQVRLR